MNTTGEKQSVTGMILKQVLKLTVAGLLLWWVVSGLEISQLRELSPSAVLPGAGCAFLLIVTQIVLSAIRWKLLLGTQKIFISTTHAVSLTFQGCLFSLILPGGAVGGDVVKAAFLAKETKEGHKVEGVTTIFLDRVVGILALFLIVIPAALLGMKQILQFNPALRIGTLLLLGICLAGLLCGTALFLQDLIFRVPLFRWCLDHADALLKGKLKRILDSVALYRHEPGTLLKTLLIGIAGHLLLAGSLYGILCGIEGRMLDPLPPVIASLLGNAASAVPVTPGGLGTRDKLEQILLAGFGLPQAAAGLAPLIYTTVMVCTNLLGLICFLADSFRKKKQA